MTKLRSIIAPLETGNRKTFSFEEAFEASKEYFFGDELAAKVCIDKYFLRNEKDELVESTPEDMHIRLASEFARIDYEKYGADYNKQYKLYYDRFKSFSRLVPQGSPMAAIGNPYQTLSASNCVVIESPEDSISGIMKTATELAQLFKRRAGVGTDISKLRPDGFRVKNAARTTSGAWSFADLFSYITGKIGQCLHEDTKILTRKGIKEIKNVHPSNEVWTKKGWIPVTGTIKNKKSCVKVTTKFGHEIICSEDHVFHTTEGEKAIKDLVVGDLITQIVGENGWEGGEISLVEPTIKRIGGNKSCRLNTNINFPKLLSEKLAYIIGYSYGDGCVSYKETTPVVYELSLALDPAWGEIITKTQKYVKDIFDYNTQPVKGDGCLRLRLCSKQIIKFLRRNGLLKQKSEALVFPEKLLKAKSSVIFAFISGYFDADGDVSKKKSYRFRSVRREFLAEIQNVLSAHGIPSKIHTQERKEENWRTIYTLSVNGGLAQANFRKFMQESVKVASYPEFEKVSDHTRTAYQTKDFDTKASRHKYIINDSQWITYSTSRRLCDDLNIKSDYYLLQDEITDIELYDSGKQQTVYDLMLPDEHLFFANGMYAHNSGRRGALMVTISVHHPDIEKFAKMKADKTAVTKANVSIRITDEFMRAVESDSDYEQRWPCEGEAQFSKMVSAKAVWNTIIEMATLHAEPGLIFWDNATERLPAESYEDFKSVCVNPCGEIILAKNGSCRLLSMNLTGYVRNAFTDHSRFDYKSFQEDIKIAMRLLDNLVDLELELIEQILKSCDSPEEIALWKKLYRAGEQGRRTGLGTHGLADTLAQLRIKYDSEESIKWVDKTYKTLRDCAYSASADLAEERGPFPVFDWEAEKDNPFIADLPEKIRTRMASVGRRNISILTQAPTGTVSLVSKCGEFNRHSVSSGVEPTYRLSYIKRKKINRNDSNSKVDHVDKLGDRWQDYSVFSANLQNYYEAVNPPAGADLPDYFVTSDKIDWQFRVKLQGTEQKYIDHCISSTVNLPKGTTPEVVGGIYMRAWKENLKGITVYVDGSRMGVMLEKPKNKIIRHKAPERPRDLPCDIHFHTVKGEPWTALVGCLNGEPYELFGGYGRSVSLPQKYKKGFIRKRGKGKYDLHIPVGSSEFLIVRDIIRSFNDDEIGWTTRLVSLALIHGAKIDSLVTSLQKDGNLHSFNKVLARVLKKYIPDGQKVEDNVSCMACGSNQLVWQEGCVMCASCGHSACM